MKTALVTGITGQDGSYLSELLLSKGYNVIGLIRRKSKVDYGSSSHLLGKVTFEYGDMTDMPSLIAVINKYRPSEVYNLAAQSFVPASWNQPSLTAQVNALGVINILEAIRACDPENKIRFYQASTSEMYGGRQTEPQSESTEFYPRSPYAAAKVMAHWTTINYRESYGMYNCSGILFNHESERRGLEFVTRKITDAVAKIKLGILNTLELGNLDAKRDWGHSEDYVRGMWMMLQQDEPQDFVIASEESHSVRDFVTAAFKCIDIEITWEGEGTNEVGIDTQTKKTLIKINPDFFRPAEVHFLQGNAQKAHKILDWKKTIPFQELVNRMVKHDLDLNEAHMGRSL